MGLRLLDKAFWLTGFLGQCLLLGILVSRKRTRRFPLFTSFIAFEIAQTVLNFAVYQLGNQTEYFRTYWTLAVLDALLQLAVVFEMAREVFRPTGTWVSEARTLFLGIGLAGAAIAAGLSFAVDPKATRGLYAWFIRLDLFTSLLIAELVVAMFLAASRVGLQWRNWVMGMAEGLGIWVSVSLAVETAHSYWGWTAQYVTLDYLRMGAFLVALGYWCVSFWRTEPKRRPMSPEMKRSLAAIHDSLGYDLESVIASRKNR